MCATTAETSLAWHDTLAHTECTGGVAHSRALDECTLTHTHYLGRILYIVVPLPWQSSTNPFNSLIPCVQLVFIFFPITMVGLLQSTLGLSSEVIPACFSPLESHTGAVLSSPILGAHFWVEDDISLSAYITAYFSAVLTLPGGDENKYLITLDGYPLRF